MKIGFVGHVDIGKTTAIAAHIIQHQTPIVVEQEQSEKQFAPKQEFVITNRFPIDFAQPKKSGKELRRERRKHKRKK